MCSSRSLTNRDRLLKAKDEMEGVVRVTVLEVGLISRIVPLGPNCKSINANINRIFKQRQVLDLTLKGMLPTELT